MENLFEMAKRITSDHMQNALNRIEKDLVPLGDGYMAVRNSLWNLWDIIDIDQNIVAGGFNTSEQASEYKKFVIMQVLS